MDWDVISNIVLSVLALGGTFLSYYQYVKVTVANALPQVIDDAELPNKKGAEKFAEAVEQAMALVPAILRPLITRTVVEKAVQRAFDKIDAYGKKQAKK
ncbi:MAG: hypothetical protein WC966_10860 [Bradymonadales bacterium]